MNRWVDYFEQTKRSIFSECLRNRRLIELILKHAPPGGRVLEAGCGTALLSLILVDLGFKVTALYLSEEVLDYAKRRTIQQQSLKLDFVLGDIRRLSSFFGPRHFDAVCHSGVLEHFKARDIVQCLSEQRHVARKTIFCVPNRRAHLDSNGFGDENLLKNAQWMQLIQEAGFRNVSIHGCEDLPNFLSFLPGIFFHRKRASFWWKWFSGHSVFVCS